MDNFLWWIGWRAKVALFLFLAVGIGMSLVIESTGGMFFGIPFIALWIWGTVYINSHWIEFFKTGSGTSQTAGAEKLGTTFDETEAYMLYYGQGSAPLVKPSKKYLITVLYVGDKFLGIYEGCTFGMVERTSYAGTGTKEFYYRHINSVDFKAPFFEVRSSSGESLEYQSTSSVASSAINAVRKKLRQAQE